MERSSKKGENMGTSAVTYFLSAVNGPNFLHIFGTEKSPWTPKKWDGERTKTEERAKSSGFRHCDTLQYVHECVQMFNVYTETIDTL